MSELSPTRTPVTIAFLRVCLAILAVAGLCYCAICSLPAYASPKRRKSPSDAAAAPRCRSHPAALSPGEAGGLAGQANQLQRLESLVHGGNLYLTAQDVIALVLENNLDIAVQRYSPFLAQEVLRRTKAADTCDRWIRPFSRDR